MPSGGWDLELESRARRSRGSSGSAIYAMACRALDDRAAFGGTVVDLGCGTGNLWAYLGHRFTRYIGVDVVWYAGLPEGVEVTLSDLNQPPVALASGIADVAVAIETIEHLENPRAFVRELARLVKPGGWVLVTTPNQLSLLSLLNLAFRRRFVAFQEQNYPAHLTALLEIDLRRIAAECKLVDVAIDFTLEGRVPTTNWHYPRELARRFPRALSENVMMIARKPGV